MATITETADRITISGAYKALAGGAGNTTTVIQYASGDAPTSADEGRFLMWKDNLSQTKTWQIRYIESATASTITVGDGGFNGVPPSGASFQISTSLSDIEAAVAGCTVNGFSYSFNGRDWLVTSGAFLGDVDVSLDTENTANNNCWQASNGTAVQFGRLTGGEANGSTITRQGCYISMQQKKSSSTNVFTSSSTSANSGPIYNFYGCYVKSYAPVGWAFMRGSGPVRMIGSIFDGPLGGAFYNANSELVDTKFRGATNQPWALRATLVRPVSEAQFSNATYAFKTFQAFKGEFRDTTFDLDSLGAVVQVLGNASGGATLVDCTTFDDSYIFDGGGGFVNQAKSVNYTLADINGVGLSGVRTAIYDVDGTLQTDVQESISGASDEIVATGIKWFNASPSVLKSPFSIRIRKYGYVYQGFESSVDSSIKQEVRLPVNTRLVSTESQAALITGISLDFVTSTINLTEDADTQRLYDYYQYELGQTINMPYGEDLIRSGTDFDFSDWDMNVDGCTYTGNAVTTGLITLLNGGIFNGVRTDANGTVAPPKIISITGLVAGSRFELFNVTTGLETANLVVAGTTYTATYSEGVDYTAGDAVRIRVASTSGATAMKEYTAFVVANSVGFSAFVSQEIDEVYNTLAIDGSGITKFSADYVADDVIVTVIADFTIADFYAWWTYNTTTELGIRNFFGGVTAQDVANFRINIDIVNIFLDSNINVSVKQTDNRRIYRDDDTYPVRQPTTSGYGLDVVWRNLIFVVATGTSGLTPSESAQLAEITSVKGKTDLLNFTGDDIKATLDGEVVTTDTVSRDASKADVSGLSTFNPVQDTVANVDIVNTVTTNTDMRGTDSAITSVAGLSTFNVATDQVITDLASRNASKADVSSLSTFNPATDTVANVTLVDAVTVNADMRGTDGAVTSLAGISTFNVATESVITDTASREASKADVTDLTLKVDELHLIRGLSLGSAATFTPESIAVGGISLTITGDGETTSTVTRNA